MNLRTQYSIIGGSGAVFLLILILVSLPSTDDEPIPITPVGEQIISNQTVDDVDDGDVHTSNSPVDIIEPTLEEMAIGEEIKTTFPSSSGVIAFRSGGGGGSSSGDDEPSAEEFSYQLKLFEDNEEIQESDGFVNLGQNVRALAITDDSSIDMVTFRWIDPSPTAIRIMESPIDSGEAQDVFEPDKVGIWIVEADFGNGIVVKETVDTSFFVVPESPIGVVALLGASFATIAMYLRIRRPR